MSRWVYILAGVVGLGVCFVLSGRHAGISAAFCSDDFASGCSQVLTSRYASVLGGRLPLAHIGVGFYALALGVGLVAVGTGHALARMGVLALSTGGALTSLLLVGIQAFVVRGFCPLCLMSAGCALAMFGAALLWVKGNPGGSWVMAGWMGAAVVPVVGVVPLVVLVGGGKGDEVLARFDGVEIRMSDLNRDEPTVLDAADHLAYYARSAYVRKKLGSLAVAARAEKLGVTPEELIRTELDARATTGPSDAGAGEDRSERWQAWTGELLKAHATEVYVRPPPGRRVEINAELALPAAPVEATAAVPLVLTVFSDLECPVCAELDGVLGSLEKSFGGKLSVHFRHFPLRGHVHAEDAAVLAEAVYGEKGREAFATYKTAVFARRGNVSQETLVEDAKNAGLTEAEVAAALSQPEFRERVRQSAAEARALKLGGAPTLVLNGRVLQTSFDEASLRARLEMAVPK